MDEDFSVDHDDLETNDIDQFLESYNRRPHPQLNVTINDLLNPRFPRNIYSSLRENNESDFDHLENSFYVIDDLKQVKRVFYAGNCSFAWTTKDNLYAFGAVGRLNLDSGICNEINLWRKQLRKKYKLLHLLHVPSILKRSMDKLEEFVPPTCVGQVHNLHKIFGVGDVILMWSGQKIEIIGGYRSYNFNKRFLVYSAPDILYVFGNSDSIFVVLEAGRVDWIRCKFTELCFWHAAGTNFVTRRIENTNDICGIYMANTWCLFLREYNMSEFDESDGVVQQIDFYEPSLNFGAEISNLKHKCGEFKNVNEFLSNFGDIFQTTTLFTSALESVNIDKTPSPTPEKCFPMIYDGQPWIKIFGSGSIDRQFNTKYYRFLPNSCRAQVILCLWILRHLKPILPRFVKYEVLKYFF